MLIVIASPGVRKTQADIVMPIRDDRVKRVIRYLEDNYIADTIDEIAEYLSVSVPALVRIYKDNTGMTVVAWRREKRMAKDCKLLSPITVKVADVAQQIGYHDQLCFSRCFRKHFNLSPS